MATRKTLCFTGMDTADEAALKDMFAKAAERRGNGWILGQESTADALVVDVDSLYGHMTWLKVHNSGRMIAALSTSPNAEADHVLVRPVTVEKLADLLDRIEGRPGGAAPASAPEESPAASSSRPVARAEPAPELAAPAARPTPRPAPPAEPAAVAKPAPAPAPEPEPEPEPEPAAPPRDPMLADYFERDALPGPVKMEIAGAPVLALDPQRQRYVGPAALKPLIPYCKQVVRPEDWVAITPAELEKLKAAQTEQPFSRLLWLFALVNGEGQLAAGFDPDKKFRLTKWPQIEREYPRHFRVATVMMKQPATLAEVAEQSGAPLAEVTDFVNAYLATGFAEMEEPPAPVDANAQKSGFLGRLRGLRNG